MPRPKREKITETGRPSVDIDWSKVDQWLIRGNKGTAIAARIGIHPDTLYMRCLSEKGMAFSDYSQQKRSIGASMIENTQFEVGVVEKNVTMLIWLGKSRCGQRDADRDVPQAQNVNLCTLLELSKSGKIDKEAMEALLASLIVQKPEETNSDDI